MLRIQATIGLTTYYFASEALDYANRYWEPRISNAFQISREFNSADKTGNKIRSVDISLDNRDGFFNSIYTADGLVNGKFVLYFNEGDNVVKTFTGRVNKINSFGDDISLTLREVGYEYLTRKFPDAQIAYDYYSASGINDSWNAIPIHLGTVNRYPCPWVNLFESHFIIGSGPIHAVKKIYFDKTVVYDSSTGQNGYKPTPDSPEIKFRVFKGARAGYTDIVEGVTSSYPGFAYIQLYKIVDAVEQPADPVNPDGEAVQIYVDIEGLQNEAGTGAERNPAQILYQFFTKPYTAEEGYGLAVDSDDLDFASAITECAIQGFKIDGSVDNTTDFGEWVDEILRCCRGQLYENNGKISVRIDAAAAAPSIHFDETGELGYNCIVDTWTEPERDAQTNRVRLSYSWNFENSNFNKKPSYNQESPIGDTNLQNPTHAARIQKWNTETLEYKLIKDDTTAHKLAQYYLNNIVKQLITTSLTTEVDIPNTVDAGTVVKVTSPKFGWNQKLFRITNISRAEENTEIKLKEYDASIFTFIDPGTGVETDGSQYSVYNIPAKPKLTSLSVVNELLADGSTQTRINVNFVAPTENSQLVALYYKPAGGTEADFKPLDTALSSAGTMSAIWKGIESGNYNFRLVTISPVGIYSDLSIVSGDKHYYGQPGSEGTVALTGDTIAPGKPSIDDFLLVQGAVTLHFNIPTGFPSDFSHFAVYRKLDGGSLLPLDMKYTGRLFTDTDVAGYVSRQYSIVAYDKSNNPSESSDLSVVMTPLKVMSDDITDQPIIGKCFLTGALVGVGNPGIRFDSTGICGYSATQNTFTLCATTGDVSMTGTITALAGNIGGFTIDPIEGLHAGCTTTRVQMKPGAGFWAGATAQVDAPFSVTQAGVLKSTSGTIGGFSIGTNILCSTPAAGCSVGMSACNTSEAVAFWAGCSTVGSAPFRVTNTGAITACSGVIGGLTLLSDRMCLTIPNGWVILGKNQNGGQGFQWAENLDSAWSAVTIGNCLWTGSYVARTGIAVVVDSVPYFEVHKPHGGGAVCAKIAGWNFNATQIYSTGCGLILCNTGAIQTGDFVTSNKGWKIDSVGNAEFNNICARGAIRTAVFIKDQVSVVGGCTLIRPAGTAKNSYDPPCDTYSLYLNDEVSQFAINDIIRIKDGMNDYWGRVCACSCLAGTGCYITFVKCSGARFPYEKGQAVVNYGSCLGCGGIMLNGQCPYIDLYTHAGLPWCALESRVRIGNLNGWGSFSAPTYGIAAGCPTGQYMTYDSVSGALNIKGVINIMPGSEVPAGLINNHAITGSLNGYTYENGLVSTTKDGKTILAHRVTSAGDSFVYGPVFKVDPTQAYKITLSVCDNCACGTRYFGIYAYDCNGALVQVTPIYPSTGNCGTPDSNHYFWSGDATGAWRDMEGYVLPHNVNPADVPAGKNVSHQFIMPPNTACIRIRYLNYYNAGITTTADFYSPSVIPVTTEGLRKVYKGLDANGTLISRVVPASVAAPSGSGLYLGSDYMGFHNGSVWKTYMDNTGNFYLGGSAAGCGLAWNATTNCLTVCGCITSCAGTIGGWTICSYLSAVTACGAIYLVSGYPTIYSLACGASCSYAMHGKMYWNGSYQNSFGFSVTDGASGALSAGMGYANIGTVTLPSSTVVACGCPFFYVGSGSTNYMQYYGDTLTVKGDIEVMSSGNILPDPDFRGVEYAASYLPWQASGTIVGEYVLSGSGTYNLATVHRTGTCAVYAKSNSNAMMIYAANSSSHAMVSSLNFIPVQCGATYTLSGYLAKEGANPSEAYLGLLYYDINRALICYDYPAASAVSTLTTTPTRYIGVKVMPANAAYVKILIYNYQPSLGTWLYISGLQLELGSVATAWKNNQGGTITANSIKSGALQSLNWNGSTIGSCINLDDGTFKFGGDKLTFDGTNLSVSGCITSGAGCIGGWNITGSQIIQTCIGGVTNRKLEMNASVASIHWWQGSASSGAFLGQVYNAGWTGRYGLAVVQNAVSIFEASYDTSNNLTAKIAGWNFNAACLYSGNLIMNSSGAIQGNYSGDVSGWCIDAAGNAKFNNATVRGTVCASQGCIGCFRLYNGALIAEMPTIGSSSITTQYNSTPTTCEYITMTSYQICFCRLGFSGGECGMITRTGTYHYYRYNDSAIRQHASYHANYMELKTVDPAGVGEVCSKIFMASSWSGLDAAQSPITICMFGGNGCFAICTNGQIQSSYTYSTVCSYSPVVCATTCVRAPYILSTGRIEASRLGYVGTYNYTETQGIWSMGSSYMPDATTTDFNTLYGMGYSYSTVGGGYFSDHHQVHWVLNGTVNASMSLSGYLWVRNYVISTCVLGTTCVCGAVTCGTTCVISPIICGTTCVISPIICGTTCVISPIICGTTCVMAPSGLFIRTANNALIGCATGCEGVFGCASVCIGVRACASCYGILSQAVTTLAIYGGAPTYGVYGQATCTYGVYGTAPSYGVYGNATTTYPVAGNGAYYNASTRTLKQGFEDVMVLPGLRNICIQKWSWSDINQRGFDEFIAPTAEDVANAFGLTFKDDGYYTLDGIALKAAQEIDQNVQVHDTCIEFLKERNSCLESCVQEMAYKLKLIEERLGIN